MSIERLADLFFGMIQEEAAENGNEPWIWLDVGDEVGKQVSIRFSCNRIGNTLHIEDNQDGKCYTLTLEEKVKP